MAMTHVEVDPGNELMQKLEADFEPDRVDVKAVAVLARSEVEAQLDAAHKHHRSVKRFISEAVSLATLTRPVAESCIYSIPRDGKLVAGPSVRLAEIVASAYGNLHVGARVLDVEETVVVAQGVAWDLEKNLKITTETRRKIVGKGGRRFSEDMIVMTGNAAASIALRNAIFRVVPRAYVDAIYAEVRRVAVGDAKTLDARRREVVDRLAKIGVPTERVFAKLGKAAIEDINVEDLEVLIGLGTAIKGGELPIDDAFPPPAPAPAAPADDGRRISIRKPRSEKIADPEPQPQREPGEDDDDGR